MQSVLAQGYANEPHQPIRDGLFHPITARQQAAELSKQNSRIYEKFKKNKLLFCNQMYKYAYINQQESLFYYNF